MVEDGGGLGGVSPKGQFLARERDGITRRRGALRGQPDEISRWGRGFAAQPGESCGVGFFGFFERRDRLGDRIKLCGARLAAFGQAGQPAPAAQD